MIRRGRGEFSRAGVDGFEHRLDAQRFATGTNVKFFAAGLPGNLSIRETELLQFQHGVAGELIQAFLLQKLCLGIDQSAEFGKEPGIDAAEGMNLGIALPSNHCGANAENSLR